MKSVTRSLITVALHEAALALCEEGRPSRAAACNEALRALSADTGDEVAQLRLERDNALGTEKALSDNLDTFRQAYASLHSELEKVQAQRGELSRELEAVAVGVERRDTYIAELEASAAATLRIIKTEDLASELCRRMALGKPLGDYHEQAAGKEGIPGELDTVGEAKEIAREILRAAKRNGLGGCALCAS